MPNAAASVNASKDWELLFALVVLNLVFSVLAAMAALVFSGREGSTFEFERPYSTYVTDQIDAYLKAEQPREYLLREFIKNRGIPLQALIWALSAFLLRIGIIKVLGTWTAGITVGLLLGFYTPAQTLVLLAAVVSALGLKKLFFKARAPLEEDGI